MIVGNDQDGDDTVIAAHVSKTPLSSFLLLRLFLLK